MTKLEAPHLLTIERIYQWYEKQESSRDNAGMPSSYMGHECDRFHWYAFRWAAHAAPKPGKLLRLFRTGQIEEERILEDLRNIGCEVTEGNPATGKQWKFWLCGGHVVVKPDGMVLGLPDSKDHWHTIELKTANNKNFNAIVKHGLRKAKYDHYIQCQLQMHASGCSRCLYIIKNKDTEELHGIRFHHDREFCETVLARARKIIETDWAPPKLHDDPDKKGAWQCRFCDFRGVCHEQAWARVNCRTCIHAKVGPAGKWLCGKHGDTELDYEKQQAGCDDHLYLPDLVPGEQVDCDPAGNRVVYTLSNGREYADEGRDKGSAGDIERSVA